ncbi:MAG: cytidylate kinase-like family protein [Bacteroides sp.]|nr:cytidylate kinase-like family protein [Bacteroides sp.]MCM1549133.1 cytidylate kinase-like family protein [Clostridium sp.]
MKNYIITIARGFGSGGKDVGNRLAKELGIPCYEREILDMASEKTGLNVGVFMQVDEKLRRNAILKNLQTVQTSYAVEPTEKDFVSDENLFFIQAEIIRALAQTQSCIIVGKCADYILKDYDNVISVYIEAPRAACVEEIIQKLNVSEKRAHQLIKTTDTYRANYYRYYTRGRDWTNPINYDMTLNSDKVGRENCVKIIKNYVDIRFGMEEGKA